MKVAIFSDLHLHNWKYGAHIDAASEYNSRLIKQNRFVWDLHNYCLKNRIDVITFCGDLFHTHGKIDTEVMVSAVEQFNQLGRDRMATALVGNHDMKNKSGTVNSTEFLLELGWQVVLPGQVFETQDFAFFSFTHDKEIFDKAMEKIANNKQIKYVFMHQGVKSVPVGSGFEIPNEFLSDDIIPPHVKYLFTGHYHRHQKVSDRLIVIGSPMQHTWSDSGEERGFIVLDTDTDEWEFIPYTESPKFVEITKDSFDKKSIPNNFIRVSGQVDEELRKELLSLGAESVEFKPPTKKLDVEKIYNKTFNLNEVIKKLEKDLDDEHISVGRKIRSNSYEIN